MMAGISGSLLVFTGLWHAFEWMMGGRNRDTAMLIPVGIVYAVLGYLIVTFRGGMPVLLVSLVLVSLGGIAAFTQRNTMQIRPWVTWAFILIDIVIVIGLVAALLG